MKRERIQCFVDGFNLYHAIDRLGKDHLKWNDLRSVVSVFVDEQRQELREVYYFSAWADWLPSKVKRHREYVAAIQAKGCTPIMGRFSESRAECRGCRNSWKTHEEKETDVNIALQLLLGAAKDDYDTALLVSRDSDLTPAVRMVLSQFPNKTVRVISPPKAGHSKEIAKLVGRNRLGSIKEIHLERNLLPRSVVDGATRSIVATRPHEYAPPA